MRARTWACVALGGGMGTMGTVYQRHSFVWLCVGEGLLIIAFILFQLSLRQQVDYFVASVEGVRAKIHNLIVESEVSA